MEYFDLFKALLYIVHISINELRISDQYIDSE